MNEIELAIKELERASSLIRELFNIQEGESEVKKLKCTDCHKDFTLDKGTYDPEWGFHCVYCGGIGDQFNE